MKKAKQFIFLILILVVSISISGCTGAKSNQSNTSAIDGGVFMTVDKGLTWKQKNAVLTVSGKPATLSGTNIALMAIDPSDHMALYYAPIGNGLFYSYDGGATWQKTAGIPKATVRSLSIDPKDKCVIYASLGNKVYKTEDCSRTWERIYFDNDVQVTVDAVTVSPYDSKVVYIGVSRGDLIKSLDAGKSWQTVERVKDKITSVIFDPTDASYIYLVTAKKGFYRSVDGGVSWEAWNSMLKENELNVQAKDILMFKDHPGVIYIAVSQGIIKTIDNGENWEKIDFIPPGKNVNLNSLAVNPANLDEIYYVTNKTFYYSVDGGKNWTPNQLKTTRAGWKLLIDPVDPKIIYMGVRQLEKK